MGSARSYFITNLPKTIMTMKLTSKNSSGMFKMVPFLQRSADRLHLDAGGSLPTFSCIRWYHTGWLPVTWLNTIWLNFFVESFGFKILGQVTTKLGQLHSNSRNKNVNSRKYHNVGHMRCMHARPHRRKDQLPLRSLRDLRSR